MEKSDMSVCTICGKHYKTCISCKNLNKTKPWRSITDTVECYKIFLVLSQYNNNHITKEEAKKQLENLSFIKKDLKAKIQDEINEIMLVQDQPKKISGKNTVEKNVNSN